MDLFKYAIQVFKPAAVQHKQFVKDQTNSLTYLIFQGVVDIKVLLCRKFLPHFFVALFKCKSVCRGSNNKTL